MIQLGKDIMVEHATLFISKLSYTLQIDIPCKDGRNLIQFISIIYRGLVISQTSYLTSILLESYNYFYFCGPLFFKIIQILSNILSTISMRLSVAKPENFKKYYACMKKTIPILEIKIERSVHFQTYPCSQIPHTYLFLMLSSSHHWNRLWNLSLRISPARNLASSLLDAGEICKVAIFSTSFHITYLTYTSCDSMQHLRDSIFFTVRLLTVFFSQDVKIMSCKKWKYGSEVCIN